MIDTIIFDFGDVLINLEKDAQIAAFKSIGIPEPTEQLIALNTEFEKGLLTELQFLTSIQQFTPKTSLEEIKSAWNTIIGDFPLYRLEFLEMLANRYRLFLITNTDAIHIEKFENNVGATFSNEFYRCFEKVYYSFETGMRKPEEELFKIVIRNHALIPKHTLFIDDKKANTDVAEKLGIQVWNINPGVEDVVNLFDQKQFLL